MDVSGDALLALLVRRDGDRRVIVERRVRPFPAGTTSVPDRLRAAVRFQSERGVRHRAIHLAVPDETGSCCVAHVAADRADLSNDELRRELYEHTPFEPPRAELRHRLLLERDRSRYFQVVAVPWEDMRSRREVVAALDLERAGLGFTSAAMIHGADALGWLAPDVHLVEVGADRTHVLVVGEIGVRRYLLPGGRADLADPESLRRLAGDVRRVAEYHHVVHVHHGEPDEDAAAFQPTFRAVGAWSRDAAQVEAVRAATRMEPAPAGAPSELDGDLPGADELAVWTTALGAALESLAPPSARITLRAPPATLPARSRPRLLVAGVVGIAVLAGLYLIQTSAEPDPDTRDEPVAAETRGEEVRPGAALQRELVADLTARVALDHALSEVARLLDRTQLAPVALRLDVVEGGRVEVSFEFGPDTDAARRLALIDELPLEPTVARGEDGTWRIRATLAAARSPTTLPTPGRAVAWPAPGSRPPELSVDRHSALQAARRAVRSLHGGRATGLRVVPEVDPPGFHRIELVTVGEVTRAFPERLHPDDRELAAQLLAWAAPLGDEPTPPLASTRGVAELPPVEVLAREDGLTVRWPAASRGARLEWRRAGEEGWSTIDAVDPAGGALDLPLPQAAVDLEVRLVADERSPGPATPFQARFPATLELVRAVAHDAVEARLTRPWNGAPRTVAATCREGERVFVTDPETGLEFAADHVASRLSWELEQGIRSVQVPAFSPDGTVGTGPTTPVEVQVVTPKLRVELTRPGGDARTWFGKMTDG